jgi:hypothetical protein
LKSVVMKTILLSMQKNLFVHTSHIIAVGWQKRAACHFLRMRYVQCRLCWIRSVMKGNLILRTTLFLPYIPPHCSWVREICKMALTAHVLQGDQVWLKSVIIEGNFTVWPKQFFARISRRIAVVWPDNSTWHSLCTCYN